MLNKQKTKGLLIGLMVLLVGCGTSLNNEDISSAIVPNSSIMSSKDISEQEALTIPSQKILSEEEQAVIERAKDLLSRSTNVYFTFVDMGMEFYDHEAPFNNIGSRLYQPVTKFNTIQELKNYGSEVFSTAFAEEKLYFVFSEEIPVFVEQDGKLYITTGLCGMGWPSMPFVDTMELVEMTKDKAVVTCYVSLYGLRMKKYKFTLVNENEKWVLDDLYDGDMESTDFTLIPLDDNKIDDELSFYTDLATYMSLGNVSHLDWEGMVLTYI